MGRETDRCTWSLLLNFCQKSVEIAQKFLPFLEEYAHQEKGANIAKGSSIFTGYKYLEVSLSSLTFALRNSFADIKLIV
jgi:hypothetical protein